MRSVAGARAAEPFSADTASADGAVNRPRGLAAPKAYVAVWMNLMTARAGLRRPKFRLTML